MLTVVAIVAILLALANGANDNFKGVATLLGSGSTTYRKALAWATITTFLGSLTAVFVAAELIAQFQGKGLVSPEIAADPTFVAAVALGAGATVLLATRIGMPTSTTHALIGALVGGGLATGGAVQFAVLGSKFLIPLLTSPLIALVGTMLLYPVLRRIRQRTGVTADSCVCVGARQPMAELAVASVATESVAATIGHQSECTAGYQGTVFGAQAGPLLDRMHFLSGGAMGFARGLNDTPKIAALLLVSPALGATGALLCVGIAIALGGLLAARRVARTMSYDITPMNAGQGFTTNIVTAALVLVASPLGMPVSTTHVSNGALFGLGILRGDANRSTIKKIVATWIVTLPMAGLIAAGFVKFLG